MRLSDHAYARVTIALPDWAVRLTGRLQARVHRVSRGRLRRWCARAPVLVLTTTGRKTGKPRRTTVIYHRDEERLVVIGSNPRSERPPAWALNLLANPEADVQIGGSHRHVRARLCDERERAQLWRTMNTLYGAYEEYQARTERELPVFVLTPA
jgi:deazaflavin-dependent oxidoreductase (nitroreductase family)